MIFISTKIFGLIILSSLLILINCGDIKRESYIVYISYSEGEGGVSNSYRICNDTIYSLNIITDEIEDIYLLNQQDKIFLSKEYANILQQYKGCYNGSKQGYNPKYFLLTIKENERDVLRYKSIVGIPKEFSKIYQYLSLSLIKSSKRIVLPIKKIKDFPSNSRLFIEEEKGKYLTRFTVDTIPIKCLNLRSP